LIAPPPTNPVDVRIGAQVRARRLALGFSQAHFGCLIGASELQVAAYEQGSARIGAATLSQVARALEAPIRYFFETLTPSPT
jgi:transcriptional regulator with XRE-family HTH domain